MSKKVKKILYVFLISVIISVFTGCGSYDYSTIKKIHIKTDAKFGLVDAKFIDESTQINLKTKKNIYETNLKKHSLNDNAKHLNLNNSGYLEADFKDVKLDENENNITIELGNKSYNVKINTNNVKDDKLEITAQVEDLDNKKGIQIGTGKYKITEFE